MSGKDFLILYHFSFIMIIQIAGKRMPQQKMLSFCISPDADRFNLICHAACDETVISHMVICKTIIFIILIIMAERLLF